MNIVILEAYHSNPGDQSWAAIESLGNLTIYEKSTQDQLIERALDADILITNKLLMTKEVMNQLPRLKLIHQLATGTDNIDKEAATAKGIIIRNAVGYSTHAVSQHVFALILELVSHVALHNNDTKNGGWSHSGDWCHMIKTPRELAGKKLGIIGFGKIGQKVSEIGSVFGMEILVHSQHATMHQYPHIKLVSLDELATESDFVTLHSPLTARNKGSIDRQFFTKMKNTAFIINTARGGLIVEDALVEALNTRSIAGAGLDVLCEEPPHEVNPLLKLDNCIITPHIAWTSYEARKRLIQIVAENISEYLRSN